MLMFLTQTGTVLGSAEMLKPVSRDLQPFRFVALDEGNRSRLKVVVRTTLEQSRPEYDWVDSYRARLANPASKPKRISLAFVAAVTVATACLGTALIYSALLR
jgi:hypothetical protein